MAASLTLSIVEIVVLLLGAIILGITIHFFITSRKNLRIPKDEPSKADLARNEWKLKYFNDMEIKDREITSLTNRVNIAEGNADEFAMELDEVKRLYKAMKATAETARQESMQDESSQLLIATLRDENSELQDQLASAQQKLRDDHHQQQLIASLKEQNNELQEQLASSQQTHQENDQREQLMASLRRQNDQLQQQLLSAQRVQPETEDHQSQLNSLKEQNDQLREQLVNLSRQISSQDESAQHLIAELRNQNQQLQEEVAAGKQSGDEPAYKQDDYLTRLMEAKHSLLEHNQKINDLLGNIEVIKEKEELQQEMARTNEELAAQIEYMRDRLEDKESEIHNIRQKETLTKEMSSMLDNAYSDFNLLQEKIRKLEVQLTSSRMQSLEHEDLKEAHLKLTSDVERYRQKSQALTSENLQLQQELNHIEDKLKEANLQRQQLQKKVAYLEEINNDLHVVSDANKKLEGQLRRIGELESMLNVVSEERDQLMQKQSSSHHPPFA
jgi:chromosome segregation ATPase